MSEFNLKGCADVRIFYRDWQQELVGIPINQAYWFGNGCI